MSWANQLNLVQPDSGQLGGSNVPNFPSSQFISNLQHFLPSSPFYDMTREHVNSLAVKKRETCLSKFEHLQSSGGSCGGSKRDGWNGGDGGKKERRLGKLPGRASRGQAASMGGWMGWACLPTEPTWGHTCNRA